MVLASIRNQDRHLRVLVKDLLDSTVVDTLPRVLLTRSAIVGFFGITQVFRMRDEIRWVEVGVTAGRRGIFVLVQRYRGLETSPQLSEEAYEERVRPSAASRTGGTHADRMLRMGCCLRRSTCC